VHFEFDPHKSESNKAKHGIDFIQAQQLWKSEIVLLNAKDAFEKRYLVIGTIGQQHWSAIITYRGPTIRLISMRRATEREIETYEKIAG
jgi:uncharacterized DUF497 family protein